jgi:hypothetical protein
MVTAVSSSGPPQEPLQPVQTYRPRQTVVRAGAHHQEWQRQSALWWQYGIICHYRWSKCVVIFASVSFNYIYGYSTRTFM